MNVALYLFVTYKSLASPQLQRFRFVTAAFTYLSPLTKKR